MPPTRHLAPTQACALNRNQTSDLLVCRPTLNLLSHTSQGQLCIFFFLLLLSFYYSCPNFCPFALLCSAIPPLPQSVPTPLSMSMGHSYLSFDYFLPLLSTIPPSPFPSGHCQSVPYFYVCGSILLISLFC